MAYDPEAFYQDADIEMMEAGAVADEMAAVGKGGGLRPYTAEDYAKVRAIAEHTYWSERSMMLDTYGALAEQYGIDPHSPGVDDAVFRASDEVKRALEREMRDQGMQDRGRRGRGRGR